MPDPKQRVAKTPDGKLHYFPADATDQEISDILNAAPTPKDGNARKSTKSWVDVAVDALPMMGGMIGGGLGATTSGAATMGVGTVPGGLIGATTGGALGESAKNFINAARGEPAPQGVGAAVLDTAKAGGVQGLLQGTGDAVTQGLSQGGRALYRGYLKPSMEQFSLSEAKAMVDAAIKEWIPVTNGGLGKAQQLIGDLKGRVATFLGSHPGQTVDLHAAADDVRVFAKRKYFKPGQSDADYQAALKVADTIDKHASLPTAGGVTQTAVDLPAAQSAKEGLDTSITNNAFGVETASATKEAQKVGRHGLRVGIEQQAPEVGPLNMRESPLIDLARSLATAVGRDQNRGLHVPSLLTIATGGASYASSHNPFAAAATMMASKISTSPFVATNAAILAAKIGDKVPGAVVADVARAAVQATMEFIESAARQSVRRAHRT